jgi:hypothetical protein
MKTVQLHKIENEPNEILIQYEGKFYKATGGYSGNTFKIIQEIFKKEEKPEQITLSQYVLNSLDDEIPF